MNISETGVAGLTVEVLQNILRDYIGDRMATVTACNVMPLAHDGRQGGSLQRLHMVWQAHDGTAGAVEWLVKVWEPGGMAEQFFGVTRPIEALAWEQGLLRREALPDDVVVPIIWAGRRIDETRAWVVMEDVGAALAVYSRSAPIPAPHALASTRAVLAGLARFHAWWERPEQQLKLETCDWLVPLDTYIWCGASGYAAVLNASTEEQADLQAFLARIPAEARQLWRDFLVDRGKLVQALAALPHTLLHHDLDDRNIGLRWPSMRLPADHEDDSTAGLVLIDWEWTGRGPAALDVARVVMEAVAVCDRAEPFPDEYWSDALPDHYFACYQRAGGTALDQATWQRSYELAQIVQGTWTLPWLLGRSARVLAGDAEPVDLPGIPAEEMRRQAGAFVEDGDHLAALVTRAMQRCC
ncbi:MAG TPA: hypothetical protein VLA19_09115 [Herpetosiphonaceae bacterium]|nr:hypothetical protein [Herpetosiphonaceae bacterium]